MPLLHLTEDKIQAWRGRRCPGHGCKGPSRHLSRHGSPAAPAPWGRPARTRLPRLRGPLLPAVTRQPRWPDALYPRHLLQAGWVELPCSLGPLGLRFSLLVSKQGVTYNAGTSTATPLTPEEWPLQRRTTAAHCTPGSGGTGAQREARQASPSTLSTVPSGQKPPKPSPGRPGHSWGCPCQPRGHTQCPAGNKGLQAAPGEPTQCLLMAEHPRYQPGSARRFQDQPAAWHPALLPRVE